MYKADIVFILLTENVISALFNLLSYGVPVVVNLEIIVYNIVNFVIGIIPANYNRSKMELLVCQFLIFRIDKNIICLKLIG
ncbi:MAG: hypothetical protein BWY95_00937 [Bacteroidetes bacterium ADurb.BinA104]|nr:MAG: hypothetical protein BWY95_00937 [Bacteroidetes bacterium ADurb.BinA104]